MDLATGNDFALFWLTEHHISRETLVCVCVCVCVVVLLCIFLWFSGNLYFLKHRAKVTTPQGASVSFNMFIVLKQERNSILRKDIETSRGKFIAHHYLRAEISKEIY